MQAMLEFRHASRAKKVETSTIEAPFSGKPSKRERSSDSGGLSLSRGRGSGSLIQLLGRGPQTFSRLRPVEDAILQLSRVLQNGNLPALVVQKKLSPDSALSRPGCARRQIRNCRMQTGGKYTSLCPWPNAKPLHCQLPALSQSLRSDP